MAAEAGMPFLVLPRALVKSTSAHTVARCMLAPAEELVFLLWANVRNNLLSRARASVHTNSRASS